MRTKVYVRMSDRERQMLDEMADRVHGTAESLVVNWIYLHHSAFQRIEQAVTEAHRKSIEHTAHVFAEQVKGIEDGNTTELPTGPSTSVPNDGKQLCATAGDCCGGDTGTCACDDTNGCAN